MAYHGCLAQSNADRYSPTKLDRSFSAPNSTVPMDTLRATVA